MKISLSIKNFSRTARLGIMSLIFLVANPVRAHFCYNDPVNNVDPLGLSVPTDDGTGRYVATDGKLHDPTPWADSQGVRDPQRTSFTGYGFLYDYITGDGDATRDYGPNSPEVHNLRESEGVNKMRSEFYSGGCKSQFGLSYDTGEAFLDTIIFGDLFDTAAQVGGFAGGSVVNNNNGTMAFHITNVAGANSFFYHVAPNRQGSAGPFRTITQNFDWTEPIDKSRCGCK